MSLLNYERRFASLRLNAVGGQASPHKVAMLLAVIDLIDNNSIQQNQILFNSLLKQRFTFHFDRLALAKDHNNPHFPFFHLHSEGFWHHHTKPGKKDAYIKLQTVSSAGVVEKHIAYAFLDEELFELLGNQVVRDLLKSALLENLSQQDITNRLKQTRGWDWLECEFIVQDYFLMLKKHLRAEKYNKTLHRKALMPRLNGRSESSIEFKHQNISAILLELGMVYIPGYKPAFNYQHQLRKVLLSHVAGQPDDWHELAQSADEVLPSADASVINWTRVLDPEAPERIVNIAEPQRRYLAHKPNYAERERHNRSLGESGEAFVLEFERHRMRERRRDDLAKEVEWRSKSQGDGLGYDIRSFDPECESELFLEVKTTNSGKYQPFFISENERAFAASCDGSFRLYRVYEFKSQPRLFILSGAVEQHVNLLPRQYQATF